MINPKEALEKLFNPNGVPKLHEDKLRYIDLHIIDGCNLNCARCFKFSPLCKDKGLMDKNKVIDDLTQLSKVVNQELDGISIIGGEPLISPDIVFYMKECRRLFPNTDITIISNGLAIPKMNDAFFEALQQCDVMIAISKYYNDKFYEPIIEMLEKHNCANRFVFSCLHQMGCAMFLQMELDESGSQDPEAIWNKCSAKNGCVLLKDGKLWSCSNHCMKYILNDYFGTNLHDYDEDGIDIYSHTHQEIVEFLKQPKKGCRYCTEDIYNCMYFPEHTKYKKSEWIK